MSDEQAGPPTEAERERRDTDYLKRAQERYAEGYKIRAVTAPPDVCAGYMKGGRPKMRAQPHASLADLAASMCPGEYPAHERERWVAGFLDADRYATQYGHGALEGRDPLKPPRKPKGPPVAEPLDLLGDAGRLGKQQARQWWDRYHGKSFGRVYHDAGEQK